MIFNSTGSLTETGIVILTVLALPAAVLAMAVLTLVRRGLGVAWRPALRTSVAEVAIVYGTVPGVMLTMVPGYADSPTAGAVSLEPFADLPSMGPVNIVGNLMIFAALGFFGPIRFEALRSVWRVLILAAVGSVAIETLQYGLLLARVSSIDDVILNAGGAAVAALLSWPWWRRRAASSPASPAEHASGLARSLCPHQTARRADYSSGLLRSARFCSSSKRFCASRRSYSSSL
ncbi:hypothetical protein J2S40_001285 [Nocardioides luteus]|uniref:VanZ-like domain-containing protein n=1 Tax=Nocardioides luteus TaxID=1844 RepID=A0ABQ5T344_9ACTN|nr:VanZ family protein [Nocardioides luteus]MDR7310227.1 hypothetical protein [Nocardioides luteus]GGR69709.1 hypothetical protein GCM10010197_41510 [Nocardioides luteus]GLJ70305.1 hypothetical protein GCM10017579_43410 [Nocardioides luteus]